VNQELEQRNTHLEERIEELEALVAESGDGDGASEWQEERQEIRDRVGKLVDHLSDLLSEDG